MSGRFIDRLTSAQRKEFPMATGFVDYFPDAMAAVAHISFIGNQKHNPGQPLHWSQHLSSDHADCVVRHTSTRTDADPAYKGDPIEEVSHAAEAAWRAMAELQITMQRVYGLPLPAGASNEEFEHLPANAEEELPGEVTVPYADTPLPQRERG